MATIQELAAQAYKSLEWKTRPNGDEYITRKDDAPAWLEDVCYAAHDGMFPDDYKYEFIKAAVDAIMDDEDPDEALDSDVDVYTGRLTAWLASSVNRMAYVDDGVDEYGWTNLDQALKVGQLTERREVYDAVYSALADLADSEPVDEEEKGPRCESCNEKEAVTHSTNPEWSGYALCHDCAEEYNHRALVT